MSERPTIERLLEAWDGDVPELITLLQLLNHVRERGITFGITRSAIELDQLRTVLARLADAIVAERKADADDDATPLAYVLCMSATDAALKAAREVL